ncbi:ABC transporter substrate-binding protein [Ramlibacter solisilvae]|uniref:ABC transporter substrate-binding protein n=1 Tax=Ramlibacter tataouinensis TaxID=94132 RepID=UPI000776E72A|nr:ABC transporter substrate-binding protein [Ramlibacter tataouinensis]
MGTQSLKRWGASLALALCMAQAAQGQDIVLGQIGPFTVIPVPDAPETNQGIKAYIAQANKAGGVRGRKLAFFELDDRYSAEGFAEQLDKAMDRKPVALLSPIGSAALARALGDKLLDKNDVVVMNAIPGAESLRNPGHPRLFHIRAGDKQQIEKIVNHARTLGMTRLGVLYQDFVMGSSGIQVAQQEASRTGGIEIKGVKSATEAAALTAAAQEMAKLGSQGVLIVGAPRFMAEGVAALRKAGVSQSIFVLSYVPPGLVVKLAGIEGARGVGIAQTYPNPNGATLPLHRDFHAAMKAEFPQLQEYSNFHLEGYLSARTVVEALRRSRDKEISPASLERALHAAGDIDFGGFRVNFASGMVGSRFVDIGVIGADGKLKY